MGWEVSFEGTLMHASLLLIESNTIYCIKHPLPLRGIWYCKSGIIQSYHLRHQSILADIIPMGWEVSFEGTWMHASPIFIKSYTIYCIKHPLLLRDIWGSVHSVFFENRSSKSKVQPFDVYPFWFYQKRSWKSKQRIKSQQGASKIDIFLKSVQCSATISKIMAHDTHTACYDEIEKHRFRKISVCLTVDFAKSAVEKHRVREIDG